MSALLEDRWGRPLRSLRISLIDRCNLRCRYCMPAESYEWLPSGSLLAIDEIERLVRIFVSLGVTKIRLTGGEPLVRKDVTRLVAALRRDHAHVVLALTTNGTLLRDQAQGLHDAGLDSVTVSLDSLQEDRFRRLTRRSGLSTVLEGLASAQRAGFQKLKINTVLIKDFNDDEIPALLELGRTLGAEVRFIEYMDVGGATEWSLDKVVRKDEILRVILERYGEIRPVRELQPERSAPARRYELADGTRFGIIASTTEPFCSHCDRSRLTADGAWYLCLYAKQGVNLLGAMRAGASDQEIEGLIRSHWLGRGDRGAEARASLPIRTALYARSELRGQPHLEMHTRGG